MNPLSISPDVLHLPRRSKQSEAHPRLTTCARVMQTEAHNLCRSKRSSSSASTSPAPAQARFRRRATASRQGHNLALTGLCVPRLFDSGAHRHPCCPAPQVDAIKLLGEHLSGSGGGPLPKACYGLTPRPHTGLCVPSLFDSGANKRPGSLAPQVEAVKLMGEHLSDSGAGPLPKACYRLTPRPHSTS